MQLLISDFLPTLPKEHIPRTLDVVALFAQQVWEGCEGVNWIRLDQLDGDVGKMGTGMLRR